MSDRPASPHPLAPHRTHAQATPAIRPERENPILMCDDILKGN
jgi:hypothetical protein